MFSSKVRSLFNNSNNCEFRCRSVYHTFELQETNVREEECGAWSYDDIEGKCFLHTTDACCGQFDKQEESENWISGYICNQCWSTRKECPCDLVERSQGCDGSTAFSSGAAKPPQTNSPSVSKAIRKIIQPIYFVEKF